VVALSFGSRAVLGIRAVVIAVSGTTLICPTDSAPQLITVSGVQFATHNYNLNVGSGYPVVQYPIAPLTGSPNGPFFENSKIGPESFTDGLSNTTAVTETVRSTATSTYATDPLGVGQPERGRSDLRPFLLRLGSGRLRSDF
jgi:hypothetical protein